MTSDGQTATPPPAGLAAAAVYFQRRPLVMLALGFGSGLPYLLVFDTLSAWLRDAGLTLTAISGFYLLTLVNPFKFLWSPLVDHVPIPWLGRRLGRRRAWLLVAQAGVIAGLLGISGADPAHRLGALGAVVLWTTFFCSTQDIVVDAWRIESAGERLQAVMAAAYQWGYRIAMIAAGSIPLAIAHERSWSLAYLVMAGLMLVGPLAALAAPVPDADRRPPSPIRLPLAEHLRRAVVDPLADFFRRFGPAGLLILAFVCFYRLSDFTLTVMNPFYLDVGFSKLQIAEVRKVFGVIMTTVGIFFGGVAVARFGLKGPLLFGAAFVPLTHLSYAWLATRGPDVRALLLCIGIDNLAEGFAGTLLIAYMSSLTSAGFTATQYALFSSLYALPGKLVGSNSGRIIETLARLAQPGGPLGGMRSLFGSLPAASFRSGAARIGLDPLALASGYVGFFIYACLLGAFGVSLALLLVARGFADPRPAPS